MTLLRRVDCNVLKNDVGLADEHVRWQETVATLDEKILNLIGDVFISAACISYYGPFTGTYRSEMVSDWVSNCVELATYQRRL